jgi:hypothetical protein
MDAGAFFDRYDTTHRAVLIESVPLVFLICPYLSRAGLGTPETLESHSPQMLQPTSCDQQEAYGVDHTVSDYR